MARSIDVIFYFKSQADKAQAVWQLFVLDQDMQLLNTQIDNDGNVTPPSDWHPRWKVENKCPVIANDGQEIWAARIPMGYYRQIIQANISGFDILIAGYPSDKLHDMLRAEQLAFKHVAYDEEGEQVISDVDLSLTDEEGNKLDVRVAPTVGSCLIYNTLYPLTIEQEIDGETVTIEQNGFYGFGNG